MMDWDLYRVNRIKAKSGWFYLNQEVSKAAETFRSGLYVYTDRRRWLENKYKIGETIRGEDRLFEQGADQDEDMYIVGFIPFTLKKHGYDKTIHRVLKNDFNCEVMKKESATTNTEWVMYPKDCDPVGTTMLAIQKETNNVNVGRIPL